MHDIHRRHRNAEHIRDDLRKHRLVALAVAVRADHDRHVACGVYPNCGCVIQAHAGAKNAHQVRRRNPASLDPSGQAQPAQFAFGGRGSSAFFKARHIGQFHRLVQRGMVVAHVIGQTCGRGVGEHIGGDKVLATHLERVKAQFAAHLIDHTLQAIGRLGAACATISIDRGGVGEHGFHVHIDVGHLIRPRHQRAVQESRRHGREVRQIGPDVRHRFGAECDERAVFFASQFNLGHMVAAMRVGQEAFRTLCHPFDGLFDLFGRGQNQSLFAVVIDL